MKRYLLVIAAAALALAPPAAAAKKPERAKDRGAKVERKAKHGASAQQRCRDERRQLGADAFAAKYGKQRTKGGAKANAKAARAAFGRCVSQTAKRVRAERKAAEEEDEDGDDDVDEDASDAQDGDAEEHEPDDAAVHADHDGDDGSEDAGEPDTGPAGQPDLDD